MLLLYGLLLHSTRIDLSCADDGLSHRGSFCKVWASAGQGQDRETTAAWYLDVVLCMVPGESDSVAIHDQCCASNNLGQNTLATDKL